MSERMTNQRANGVLVVPVAATAVVEAGKIAALNATGFAVPGSESATLRYLGMFTETVNNAAGGNGDKSAVVRTDRQFLWANSATDPVTQADMLKPCYIEDDATVSKTSNEDARSVAGIVTGVEDDGVWVAPASV